MDEVQAFDATHMEQLSKRETRLPSSHERNQSLLSSKKLVDSFDQFATSGKSVQDKYLQVAVLTNANLWSFAPQGLFKFGHLADGFLYLILVEPTKRNKFLQYVKSNGNSKDQVKHKNPCNMHVLM
jgi:hypothetical protein